MGESIPFTLSIGCCRLWKPFDLKTVPVQKQYMTDGMLLRVPNTS